MRHSSRPRRRSKSGDRVVEAVADEERLSVGAQDRAEGGVAGGQRLQHLAGSGIQDADLAGGTRAGHKQPRAVGRQRQPRRLARQRQPSGDLALAGIEERAPVWRWRRRRRGSGRREKRPGPSATGHRLGGRCAVRYGIRDWRPRTGWQTGIGKRARRTAILPIANWRFQLLGQERHISWIRARIGSEGPIATGGAGWS